MCPCLSPHALCSSSSHSLSPSIFSRPLPPTPRNPTEHSPPAPLSLSHTRTHLQASFLAVLRVVRVWAKRRGLYANKMGYLGGVNFNILVAMICQVPPRPPRQDKDKEKTKPNAPQHTNTRHKHRCTPGRTRR